MRRSKRHGLRQVMPFWRPLLILNPDSGDKRYEELADQMSPPDHFEWRLIDCAGDTGVYYARRSLKR